MPQQDIEIESLGVMGWGWVGFGNYSAVVVAVAAPCPLKKTTCLLENCFFTIGPHNRDLGALLPGNDSYGRPASFSIS